MMVEIEGHVGLLNEDRLQDSTGWCGICYMWANNARALLQEACSIEERIARTRIPSSEVESLQEVVRTLRDDAAKLVHDINEKGHIMIGPDGNILRKWSIGRG